MSRGYWESQRLREAHLTSLLEQDNRVLGFYGITSLSQSKFIFCVHLYLSSPPFKCVCVSCFVLHLTSASREDTEVDTKSVQFMCYIRCLASGRFVYVPDQGRDGNGKDLPTEEKKMQVLGSEGAPPRP